MAIPNYPVWAIRPNWREGILERLSWATDILDSTNATEQRRALRLSPRRSFEMTFNPVDEARSYFDLFLHRLGTTEIFLPLFHDKAQLSAAVSIGDVALPFDNTFREYDDGGYAILLGADPWDFEMVEIAGQTAAGLTLVDPLTRSWPKATTIHPARIAKLADESAAKALTERVGQGTVLFTLMQHNAFPAGVWPGAPYAGKPIITKEPNRRETLDLSFLRKRVTVDNETGIPYLADEANRAFTVQSHRFMMRGRQEHADFRAMLYRLEGSWQSVWLPSYNRDFQLSRDADAADLFVDVKKIGYAYTGGEITGRNHIYFPKDGVAAKIIDVGVPLSAVEERFTLEAAVGANLPAGRYGSFLEAVRLSDDEVEIRHHTDTDGVSECGVAWRSYQDERIADEAVGGPGYGGSMAGKHRYWRIKINDNHGGNFVGLSEIEFRAIKNGPDQANGGTAIYSAQSDPAWKAFDNTAPTAWSLSVIPTDFPVWIGYDFGVDGLGNDIRVSVIQVYMSINQVAGIDYTRAPKSGTIDYSDDGVAWTPYYAFNLNAWTQDGYRLVPEPPAQSKHRCWRLFFPSNLGGATWTHIGEMELRTSYGGPDHTDDASAVLGRAIGGPDFVAVATAHKGFNDNNSDYVEMMGTANRWCGFIFPQPVEILEAAYIGGWSLGTSPAGAILQYSDDEVTWFDATSFSASDFSGGIGTWQTLQV